MDDVPVAVLQVFTRALIDGDAGAAGQVAGALAERLPPGKILTDLVAPAMHEVGSLWQHASISIAVEHRASAIAEGVVRELVAGLPPAREGQRVWLTGIEGEWHTLPAQIVASVWRVTGWNVVSFTPSLPPAEIAALARDETGGMAALSCSLPANAIAAWECISALRQGAFRVLVGGRVFDDNPGLAEQFGADAHCRDALAGHEVLLEWAQAQGPGPRVPVELPGWPEVSHVYTQSPRVVEDAIVVAGEIGGVALLPSVLREDIGLILRTAVVAAAVDRPGLLEAHCAWYRSVLAGHGLDPEIEVILRTSTDRVLPAGSARVSAILVPA